MCKLVTYKNNIISCKRSNWKIKRKYYSSFQTSPWQPKSPYYAESAIPHLWNSVDSGRSGGGAPLPHRKEEELQIIAIPRRRPYNLILCFWSFLVAVDLSMDKLTARSVMVLQYFIFDKIMFFSKLSISDFRSITVGLLWLADSRLDIGKRVEMLSPDIISALLMITIRSMMFSNSRMFPGQL